MSPPKNFKSQALAVRELDERQVQIELFEQDEEDHLEVVQWLVANGAHLGAQYQGQMFLAPNHHLQMVEWLVANGATAHEW